MKNIGISVETKQCLVIDLGQFLNLADVIFGSGVTAEAEYDELLICKNDGDGNDIPMDVEEINKKLSDYFEVSVESFHIEVNYIDGRNIWIAYAPEHTS